MGMKEISGKFIDFIKSNWLKLTISLFVAAGLITAGFFIFNLKSDKTDEPVAKVTDTPKPQSPEDTANPYEITGLDQLSFESEDRGGRLNARIEAVQLDRTGLSPESVFRITLPEGYNEDFINESLTIEPSVEYSLEKDDKSFILTPKSPLDPNTVYSFKLANEKENLNDSWAFQTRRSFKINSTLPRDKATGVPVNTGIEIVFSHEGVQGIEDYFSISPVVAGKFEYRSNTAVFVPNKLSYDTIYTVTIKEGFKLPGTDSTLQSGITFQFQTEPLKRSNYRRDYFYVYNDFNTIPSDIAPYYDVAVSRDDAGAEVAVCVYRYPNADEYLENMEGYNKRPNWAEANTDDIYPETANLEKVLDQKIKITTVQDPWYTNYLLLPEPLPEGHYFVTFTLRDHVCCTFTQVNDMLAYINVGDERTICWINDNVTGEAVAGASIEGSGFKPVVTGGDGAAVIESPLGGDPDLSYINLKITRDGHPSLIATVSTYSYNYYYYDYYDYEYYDYSYYSYSYSPALKKNWTYFFTDRSVYLPSDTVSAWGIVKPRKGAEPYKKLTLTLEGHTYTPGFGYSQSVLMTEDVDVSDYGTFTTSVSYDNFDTGSYQLVLRSGDEILNTRYFYIEPYVKPQYTVSMSCDKTAIMAGEKATFEIQAKFFEGTPVSGLDIDFRSYGSLERTAGGAKSGTVTLDRSGRYLLEMTGAKGDPNEGLNGFPNWEYIYVTASNPEETELGGSDSIVVFNRDVTLDTSGKILNGTANIHFETHRVDLTEVNRTGSMYNENWERAWLGDPVDTTLEVAVFEDYWVKTETGTYYDFIQKRSYKTYDYSRASISLGSYKVDTVGGKADLSFSVPSYSLSRSYRYVVKTKDTQSRNIEIENYLYRQYQYSMWNEDYDPYYYLVFPEDEDWFQVGDTVNVQVLKNGSEFELDQGDRILYMTLQEGIMGYSVRNSSSYSFSFDEEMIPNAFVYAVIFDGRNIKRTYPRAIRYDTIDEELNIGVSTDRSEYGPGDEVVVTFDVRDSFGNPCSAEVNLSVVDEAYFALYGQSVDLLGNLYRSVFDTGINSEFISYIPYNRHDYSGAECGEGGDEAPSVRENFKDTAFFYSARTDESVKGKVSFKLPDNLTSWRLTYQAVTGDLKAGNGTMNINAKLPFFLQLVSGTTFLEGDVPSFLARGYGTELNPDEQVNYRYEISGADGLLSDGETSGYAADPTEIKLPKLDVGEYSVTVWAENGGYEDAIRKKINVVGSLLEGAMTRYYKVTDGLSMDFTDNMTTLTFYNKNLMSYYNMLWSLNWSWGDRIDQILSRKIAREQLEKYFGKDMAWYSRDTDIAPYQQNDGGIALLTYGSSDPELSAKIASLGSGFDENALKRYFYKFVNDKSQTPQLAAAAWWGLAALHEPVLFMMNDYLATLDSDPQFSIIERLYMALAYADIGDYETARRIYGELTDRFMVLDGSMAYLKVSENKEKNLTATSLCTILALKLDMPEKNSMFTYLTRKSSDEILVNLEKLIYITNVLPYTTQKSGFSITRGGVTEKIELNGIESHTIMLLPGEIKDIEFSNVTGEPVVMASYRGPLAELESGGTQPVSISRRYLVNGKETTEFKSTDLVTVELSVQFDQNAPEGYYQITDVLPAGLRYAYSRVYEDGYYYGWSDPEGRLVKLGCYYSKKTGARVLSYRARVVAPGEYTADSACVKDTRSDVSAFTGRTTVRIGN